MGYYKIKSHAGTGKLLNIAASGPISGRKNTNIWDESCPIDQTWSIASLGNNQQVKIINNLSYMLNANAELDYLIVSMNTVGNWFKPDNNQSKYGTSETLTASQFKVSNKSADILARIFCGHYERPGVPKISERVANAKKWYNFL